MANSLFANTLDPTLRSRRLRQVAPLVTPYSRVDSLRSITHRHGQSCAKAYRTRCSRCIEQKWIRSNHATRPLCSHEFLVSLSPLRLICGPVPSDRNRHTMRDALPRSPVQPGTRVRLQDATGLQPTTPWPSATAIRQELPPGPAFAFQQPPPPSDRCTLRSLTLPHPPSDV